MRGEAQEWQPKRTANRAARGTQHTTARRVMHHRGITNRHRHLETHTRPSNTASTRKQHPQLSRLRNTTRLRVF